MSLPFQLSCMSELANKVVQRLSNTFANIQVPNKLDTGLDNSAMFQNIKQDITARSKTSGIDHPGLVDLSNKLGVDGKTARDLSNRMSQLLYGNNVRAKQALLPCIVVAPAVAEARVINYNGPKANYIFSTLMESTTLSAISDTYWQSIGSSHEVYFPYKNVDEQAPTNFMTIRKAGKYRDYMTSIQGTSGSNELYNYTSTLAPEVLAKVKQSAYSLFPNTQDRQFIDQFIGETQLAIIPMVIYNSIALGVVDTATVNITITNTNTGSQSIKNSIIDELSNKSKMVYNFSYHANDEYGFFREGVEGKLQQKLNTTRDKAKQMYAPLLNKFNEAFQIGKKNPFNTYRVIYRAACEVCSWIINDINNKAVDLKMSDTTMYFADPDMEVVMSQIRASEKANLLPFIINRGIATDTSNALQIQPLGVKINNQFTYEDIAGIHKTAIVPNGFHEYIKAKLNGAEDINTYCVELRKLSPTESHSHMAGEGTEGFTAALHLCTTPGSVDFKDTNLFKLVPPILYAGTALYDTYSGNIKSNGLNIMTSMEDLSNAEMPYRANFKNTPDVLIGKDARFFPETVGKAPMILYNPVAGIGSEKSVMSHNELVNKDVFMSEDSGESNATQLEFIRSHNFIPLSSIRTYFETELNKCASYTDLQRLANEFGIVVKNLSYGFWTIQGSKALPLFGDGTRLGMTNLLTKLSSSKALDLGMIGGLINPVITNATNFAILRSSVRDAIIKDFAKHTQNVN